MGVKYRVPLERGAAVNNGATDSYNNRQSKAMADSYIDTQTDMCRNNASRHKHRTRQVER